METDTSEKKALLKLAQAVLLIRKKEQDTKEMELILEEADLNLKVPKTDYLEKYNSDLVGSTLLHVAYHDKLTDCFNILIQKGADFNMKDQAGLTVLHKSFKKSLDHSKLLRVINQDGLLNALKLENSFIEIVLSAHLKYHNVSNPSDPDGLTHFHIACATNSIKAVEFFLANGVSVDETVSTNRFAGYTALHFAVEFSNFDAVAVLLKHFANVKLKYIKERTPLFVSVQKNLEYIYRGRQMLVKYAEGLPSKLEMNEKIMIILLKHNDIDFSYLCAVSVMQNTFQLEKLLVQGIDVNQCVNMDTQSWSGYTALHFAAQANVDAVKLLLKHGGNIHAKNAMGITPFDICMDRYKVEDIFDILYFVPEWKNIVLSDGQTKLLDLLFALKDINGISNFLEKSEDNIKLFVPFDSPLWPGFTLLHIAVLLSERKECKLDYKVLENYMSFKPDLTVITECLKLGADVTVKDTRCWTPLHLAFRLEKKKTMEILMQYHHSVINVVDNDNLSHLHIACIANHQDLVEKLLLNGADANITYKGKTSIFSVDPGSTPLHVAESEYKNDVLELLIKFGANPHLPDDYSFTAIHNLMGDLFSYQQGKILFSSANFRNCAVVVENVEFDYLHVAAWIKNVDAVKRLLDLGMDVNKALIYKQSDINLSCKKIESLKSWNGFTPLHAALFHAPKYLEQEQSEVVNLLIERNANVLIKDSEGISPLHMILQSPYNIKFLDNVICRLKSNHDMRKYIEEKIGLTMLHLACYNDDINMFKEALEYGVDVNTQIDEDSTFWAGYTPLHVLVACNSVEDDDERCQDFNEILKLLLERHADVTLVNAEQRTPLHEAYSQLIYLADDSNFKRVYWMLKAHKNFAINPTSIQGVSHFHIACHVLDVDVVENFLRHNVNVNSSTDLFKNSGLTPLHLATGNPEWRKNNAVIQLIKPFAKLRIVDMLIKHGAHLDVQDVYGNTAAHAAANNALTESLIQRLINGGVNMNIRNLRGQMPVELAARNTVWGSETFRPFLAGGCRLNEFNTLTDEGCIALIVAQLDLEDMQYLVVEAFVNFPGSMKRDHLNRTAIHNIVSCYETAANVTDCANLCNTLMTFDCDIDDQDDLGRTPLHLAALFRNQTTIEGLLLTGADMNEIDKCGKTPFEYLFDSCSHCSMVEEENHNQFEHKECFKIFAYHVKKLQICKVEVSVLNEKFMSEVFTKFHIEFNQNDIDLQVKKIAEWKIEPYELTVEDFLSDFAVVVEYPTMSQDKRKVIDEFVRTSTKRLRSEFKEIAGIFQLQYRKAFNRLKIIHQSKDSLILLMDFQLPDLCLHIILRFLTNSDLKNMIAVTT